MRQALPLVLLVWVSGCATNAPAESASIENVPTAEPIFRYADLGTYGRIVLGEPFRQLDRLGVPAGDGAYYVRGWYIGTEGITVYVNDERVVTAMRFEYGPGQDFKSQLSDYTESLGAPTSRGQNGSTERVVWEDGATRFELVRVTGNDPESFSLQTDL